MGTNARVRSSRKTARKQVRLTGLMEGRLKDYSLAAAGVSALAFASPASASIATVPLNVTVSSGSSHSLNIAGNGVLSISNTLFHPVGHPNSVFAGVFASSGVVFAVNAGVASRVSPVGAGQAVPGALTRFSNSRTLVSTSRSTDNGVKKQWAGFLGNTKYLGFSFGTGPNLHYGWLQLNITQNVNHSFTVTMVQAAYEQCAGQPITAGTTTGGANCSAPPPTPAPNSLWLMALGVMGLAGLEALRRRQKTA
jgi:MYXO-CTERM domain-containing protein